MPQKKTIQALIAQKEEIEQQIEAAKREEAAASLVKMPEFKAIARKVRELNLSPSEVAGLFTAPKKASAPRKAVTVAARYRHPSDPGLTWSGRGRKPTWVLQWIESGKSMDDLRINE